MKAAILFLILSPQAGSITVEAGTATPQVSLEELYEQSVSSVENSNWSDAIAGFRTILDQDPTHTPSRFYLAVSLTGLGETNQAIATYREVLYSDSTVYEARMNLGALLFEGEQPNEAAEEYSRAMDLRPEDPVPALYRAQILYQSDRIEEAIDAYETVLELAGLQSGPASEAYRRLGVLYLNLNLLEEGRDALNEAIRLGVEDSNIFVALGNLESNTGNLDRALENYERAIELDPVNDDLQLRLALLLLNLERTDRAISILEGLSGAEAVLADSYIAAAHYAKAIPLYEQLALEEPENANYTFGLGTSYYETNQFDQAIPILERTLMLDSERFPAWGILATIYYQREDWVNAGNMLLNYLALRSNHSPSIFLLATCYDNLGDYEQALLNYNLFLELDDGSNDARSFQVTQRAQSLTRLLEDE